MKTLLVLTAGAVLGVALHYVLEFGLQAWAGAFIALAISATLFHEYLTRPRIRRGRK